METVETNVAESKDKPDKQYCSVKEGKHFAVQFNIPASILSPIMRN